MRRLAIIVLAAAIFFPSLVFAEEKAALPSVTSPAVSTPNLFAEEFYMMPAQRLQNKTSEVKGLLFVDSPNAKQNARYAVVTGFGKNVLKTQSIPGPKTIEDLRKWVDDHLETSDFQGAEIKRLTFSKGEPGEKTLYWIGQKSFDSAETAQAALAVVQTVVESQGGDFSAMVKQAQTAFTAPEQAPAVEIKSQAQFQKEEDLALRFLDHLDIGNQLYGPLQGIPSGEPIVWQSFGETTWRRTNLESRNFADQVGYWSNRIVFKGIRAPLSTIDPFVEVTPAIESNGTDFKSNLKIFGGAEWRPLSRNAWLYNVRPGGIGILEWIRNFRFYVQYGIRKPIKDEITGSRDYDLQWGWQDFYEWGVEVPPLDQRAPSKFLEYVQEYIWGEYFGNYYVSKTNFGAEEDFDAFILDSTVTLGFKTPGIPLPQNPILDELVLMPYMRFAYTSNTKFSDPSSNQYYVAAGLRWMPFRNYRFKDNEWLAKTKFFAEYIGIGDVQHTRQDGEAPNAITYDYRFGVNISSKRF